LNTKIIGLLATLLIPFLLPLLIRKYGLKVPARKWVVWYIFWIVLAILVAYQIFTIQHDLVVEPTTLDFGEKETEMTLTITNNGTGVIRWEISKPGLGWINVVPESGAVGADKDIVSISINRSSVPAGPINVKFLVVGRAGENASVTVRVVG
jgi:hypothetical protein